MRRSPGFVSVLMIFCCLLIKTMLSESCAGVELVALGRPPQLPTSSKIIMSTKELCWEAFALISSGVTLLKTMN